MRATSTSAQPQPASSTVAPVTEPVKVIVSPGNTDVRMRKVIEPRRAWGPAQSVR